jgi:dihydroflavonol-4-reductase
VGAANARFPYRQLPWHGSGDCGRARARGFSLTALFPESILFSASNSDRFVAEHISKTLEEMPGAYARSKMSAEQRALEAAASGLPVVIASPTMPIGNDPTRTPPASMLQYFMNRRIQFYLDFVLNLVDVQDVAEGLMLAMQRGRSGERYVLGGENISVKKLLAILGRIGRRRRPSRVYASRCGRSHCRSKNRAVNSATRRVPLGRHWNAPFHLSRHSIPLRSIDKRS